MNVWRNCAKHRTASMTFHFASWIGLYALAASDDEMDWHLCLKKLRRHFRAFLNARIYAHQSPFLKKVVDASPFNIVIMQDVADLATAPGIQRNNFIMKKFRSYAMAIFSSWGQTKVVEDNFQRMRQREACDTKNKAHAPCAYWAMARDMKSIEDHKREHVTTAKEPDVT